MPFDTDEFRFGQFLVDTRLRTLTVDGRAVHLHARAFDILALLIQHRDRTVSRDEMLKEVFAGQIRSDGNVPVQVHNLRRAISAAGGDPQVILTVGQSYRFVGEVSEQTTWAPDVRSEEPTAPLSSSQSRRFDPRRFVLPLLLIMVLGVGLVSRLRTLPLAAPTVPRLSIVVLPFRSAGPDRSQDYLAEAVSADLTTDLAHIPESTVIARESAESFKDHAVPVQDIGRQLGVRYVLDGQISLADKRYIIDVWLYETETGATLWSDRFRGQSSQLQDIRDDIVRRLSRTLNFQLNQLESSRSLHDRPNNPDSLDQFRQATAILDSEDSLDSANRAQKLLESSIKRQPDFGDALAELGWLLVRKAQIMDDPDKDADTQRARTVIGEALHYAPQNALAMSALARLFSLDNKCEDARTWASAAVNIEPSSFEARAVLANCAWLQGDIDDASNQLAELGRLDPVGLASRRRYFMMGYVELIQRRPREAISSFQRSTQGEPPASATDEVFSRAEVTQWMLIGAHAMAEDLAKAKSEFAVQDAMFPHRSVWRLEALFPKALARSAGLFALGEAWQAAGLPHYSDETAPSFAEGVACAQGDFSSTPLLARGATTVLTADVLEILGRADSAIVIDVGTGRGVIRGAHWRGNINAPKSDKEFAIDAINASKPRDKPAAVLVVGEGTFGCSGYNLATELSAEDKWKVYWYRGGEEAWVASGRPAEDLRLQ